MLKNQNQSIQPMSVTVTSWLILYICGTSSRTFMKGLARRLSTPANSLDGMGVVTKEGGKTKLRANAYAKWSEERSRSAAADLSSSN